MATVELIPPPEPEKQVVIRLSMAEAKRLADILNKSEGGQYMPSVSDDTETLFSKLYHAGVRIR